MDGVRYRVPHGADEIFEARKIKVVSTIFYVQVENGSLLSKVMQ